MLQEGWLIVIYSKIQQENPCKHEEGGLIWLCFDGCNLKFDPDDRVASVLARRLCTVQQIQLH